MASHDTRDKLVMAAKHLLINGTAPQELTVRQIANEAGTNPAMINYYFKSKDELVKIAVDQIISEEFNKYSEMDVEDKSPKEQLRELLLHVCYVTIKYRELTRASISYLVLKSEISLPFEILPFIRSHFGETKSESECRVIAFQLVYTLQIIFYHADEFRTYSGIDIIDRKQLQEFIDMQLNLFLGGN